MNSRRNQTYHLQARFCGVSVTLLFAVYLAISAISAISPIALAANPGVQPKRFYTATGHSVSGAFLKFYDAHGGLNMFGYPLTDPAQENGYNVQYFERQRFEYHPEWAGTSNEVLLGRLGVELVPPQMLQPYSQPFESQANRVYFKETKHSLSSAFLEYWRAYGGLRLFGYPITEPFAKDGLLTQYFERARMEYHPEVGSGVRGVQLGLLGREYMARRANSQLQPEPVQRTEYAPATQPLSSKEAKMLDSVNDARLALGMQTVSLDNALRKIALARSKDMVERNYFDHTAPDGTTLFTMLKSGGIPYKFAGEIIANNNYDDVECAERAFNGFMNSKQHHDILLDARYKLAGVGEATDARGFHFFTVVFVQR